MHRTGTDTVTRHDDEVVTVGDGDWMTVVWDDPVNLMSYVTYVFRTYFGYDQTTAERLMLRVHTKGKATVSSGNREEQERHAAAMHGYGLQSTIERTS